MDTPNMTDYLSLLSTLFDRFYQAHPQQRKNENMLIYPHKSFLLLFLILQFRRVFTFKAQRRWLEKHSEVMPLLDWDQIPHYVF